MGARRTGMAATDELQIVSSPLKTVDTSALTQEIEQMHASSPFEGIVVGKLNLIVSADTDATAVISKVVTKLSEAISITCPFISWTKVTPAPKPPSFKSWAG